MPMRITANRPSTLLGEAYECQTFTCKFGFEIERDTGRAFARMTAKATHKSKAFKPNKTRRTRSSS